MATKVKPKTTYVCLFCNNEFTEFKKVTEVSSNSTINVCPVCGVPHRTMVMYQTKLGGVLVDNSDARSNVLDDKYPMHDSDKTV